MTSFAPAAEFPTVSRNAMLGGLVAVGVANGSLERIAASIEADGFGVAALNAFGISIIVWFAIGAALRLLISSDTGTATRLDAVVAGLAIATILVPIPHLSWVGITAIALFLRWSGRAGSKQSRAGAILLAATVPMLWSRAIFAAASTSLLTIDAKLVAWIAGTTSSGNTVSFVNGGGVVFLQPACSSLANLSLAIVCGVLFVELRQRRWSLGIVAWIASAAAATILVNITRIAMIALYPNHYEQIHGTPGATIAEWSTLIVIVAILAYGTRSRDANRA